MIRSLPYAVRRVRQTLHGFENGPEILAAMARARLTGEPSEIEFRTRDLVVACPNVAGARVPVYEVQVEDAYRLAWFTAGLGETPAVVDVGAHIGNFSLAVTRAIPDARVFCFEPASTTYGYLQRNLARNGRDQVRPHRLAVAAERGVIEFTDNEAGSGLNGLTNPSGTVTTVECISLADAVEMAGGRIDLMKFDAEGAEYNAILATPLDVLQHVRRLVIEYHDVPGYEPAELFARLADAGLEVVAREPVTDRLGVAWLARPDDTPRTI